MTVHLLFHSPRIILFIMLRKQVYILWKFLFLKKYNSFNFIDNTIIRFHWFCPI